MIAYVASVGGAGAVAAMNAQRANDRADAECVFVVRNFETEHGTPTIEERQDYADCVDRLYPDPPSKTVVSVVLLAIAVGAVIGSRYGDDRAGRIMMAIFGGAAGLLTLMVATILIAGLAYVIGLMP